MGASHDPHPHPHEWIALRENRCERTLKPDTLCP